MENQIKKSKQMFHHVKDTIFLKDVTLLKSIANKTSLEIVDFLTEKPSYPLEISKKTGIDRQKVYYYIRNLEKAGIIQVKETLNKNGSLAKIYGRPVNAISYVFNKKSQILTSEADQISGEIPELYKSFELFGRFNGYICVGSPDPHGEYGASARDSHMAIMIALFIGSFLRIPEYYPVALDTDVLAKKLMGNNLIVIGGPITNIVTKMLNEYFPVKFIQEQGWMLSDGNRIYSGDQIGIVQRVENPFKKDKEVILIAGNKNSGTLAAILAASRFIKELKSRDKPPEFFLVKGIDLNSDGIVDSIELID